MKKNYKLKKTISLRQFVSEFGDSLSKQMKERLLELGPRCVLNRKENSNILDLKHMEHIRHDNTCTESNKLMQKEYIYGQFVMKDGEMYFSEKCAVGTDAMESSCVESIYAAIENPTILTEEGIAAKKIDDSNIDYVVDTILSECPDASEEHMAIISKYRA